MNLKGLSERTGIKYRTIQNYLSGERSIGGEFFTAISSQMGISASWLLTGIGPMKISDMGKNSDGSHQSGSFIQIKRYPIQASAGPGAISGEEIATGSYAFNQLWLNRRGLKANNLLVISVVGDSMQPELSEGDLVLIDHAQAEIVDGRTFVVRFGADLFVKHLQKLPMDHLQMISANKDYPPIRLNMQTDADSFQVIGRVLASMHEWKLMPFVDNTRMVINAVCGQQRKQTAIIPAYFVPFLVNM